MGRSPEQTLDFAFFARRTCLCFQHRNITWYCLPVCLQAIPETWYQVSNIYQCIYITKVPMNWPNNSKRIQNRFQPSVQIHLPGNYINIIYKSVSYTKYTSVDIILYMHTCIVYIDPLSVRGYIRQETYISSAVFYGQSVSISSRVTLGLYALGSYILYKC